MIRRCLIVDTETTGLDPKKDRVLEVGAVLYSLENGVLQQCSTLINGPAENPCENINRIAARAFDEYGNLVDCDLASWRLVNEMFKAADVVAAHRAEFDYGFLKVSTTDAMFPEGEGKPWVCTKFDFQWPNQTREGESLVSLALEHGIGVASAHRALTDCLLLAALFDRVAASGGDLRAMFARAMRPKATFQALVSFDDKDKAKSAGFQWEGDRKRWVRRMAIEDAAALNFKTMQVAS